jgi:hypothetical protein
MKKKLRSNRSIKNKKGGDCGCGSANSTLSKLMNFGGKTRKTIRIRGGNVKFDTVGIPVNAVALNGHQHSPLYSIQSERLSNLYGGKKVLLLKPNKSGKKTRNNRKKGGMGFSDWTSSSNNPILQFGTIPGANLSTSILSGNSYNNIPNNNMDLHFKPMV